MALQSWFHSQLHANINATDPEEKCILQSHVDSIINELSGCEKVISRIKEKQRRGVIWNWKSRIESYPFIVASRYGYHSTQPRISLQTLLKRRRDLVQLLGQICSKSAIANVPLIVGQHPIGASFHFGRFMEDNWLNLSIAICALIFGKHIISQLDPVVIIEYMKDCISASRNLLYQWIWSPLVEIWNTIRYSKSNIRITDEASLKQDYEALNRMVQDYGKDASGDLQAVDFELILKEYERNMKSPIKSALTGNLIRLILIQVQKGKVDLGGALLTLDKLMRANELNFELLTVIPVMAVVYLVGQKGRHVWTEIAGRSQRQLSHQFHMCLRKISVCLTGRCHSGHEQYGELLFECYKIVCISTQIQSLEANEEALKDDLSQLIEPSIPNSDKLWILQRMHRNVSF